PFALSVSARIHVYRVLQEALNNAARHSGSREAQVRLRYSADRLDLEVEDHGSGLSSDKQRNGIGLVAMRERAELLNGTLVFSKPAKGGTLVHLMVPRDATELHA